MFSKIDPGPKKEQVLDQLSDYLGWSLVQLGCCSPKHATNIGVSLIKALLCNRLHTFMFFPSIFVIRIQKYLDEWRSMEKHSLIALIVILLSHLPPPVAVLLPQLGVPLKSPLY